MSRVTIHRSVAVLLISILALAGGQIGAAGAPPIPPPGAAGIQSAAACVSRAAGQATPRGELRVSLTVSPRVARAGTRMWARGTALPSMAGQLVQIQQLLPGVRTPAASWVSIGATCTDPSGGFAVPVLPRVGNSSLRALINGVSSKPVAIQVLPLTEAIVQPQDQWTTKTVTQTIRTARSSIDIVIYDLGAQDIAEALQSARVRFRANHPKVPTIRIMVNAQWGSAQSANTQSAYLLRLMNLLGVNPATGRSADGVVAFNWSANNYYITHQKTLIIDGRRSDGLNYPNAASLPLSALAIVATFNLQAEGWPWTWPATPGRNCNGGNTSCTFVGAPKGTRDFGILVRDPGRTYTIQRVFDSDFLGPPPTRTNWNLGLNDPNGFLVWSNGTVGQSSPPIPSWGSIFAPAPTSYPSFQGTGKSSGFYPYPPSAFEAAGLANPEVKLGTVAGNARAVQLSIIRRATSEALAGRPAKLYIYNEEYSDPSVLAAIQRAAAAGVVVKIVMTFNTSYGTGYQALVTQKRTAGGPVAAAVHLYPDTSSYMYVHAKMIYADLGIDEAYVGSANFSAVSLRQNRELGVHLRASDGTLTPQIATALTTTFAGDFAYAGKNVPNCPVVVVTPAHTWNAQIGGLNQSTGCPATKSAPSGVQTTPTPPVAPAAGALSGSYFPAPLGEVSNQYVPPLPQGPMTTFVPGATQYVCFNGVRVANPQNCLTPPITPTR